MLMSNRPAKSDPGPRAPKVQCISSISVHSQSDSNDLIECILNSCKNMDNISNDYELGSKRVDWGEDDIAHFIHILIEYKDNGHLTSNNFKPSTYTAIASELYSRTGKTFPIDKLQGKYNRLRKDWRLYRDLRKNHTGFGYDAITNQVIASEENWRALVSVNKEYGKFRARGLQNYEELTKLFQNTTATGDFARASSQPAPTSDEELDIQRSMRHQAGRAEANVEIHATDFGSTAGPSMPMSSKAAGKRKVNFDTPSTGRANSNSKKSRSTDGAYDEALTSIGHYFQKKEERLGSAHMGSAHMHDAEDPYSVAKCIRVVESLGIPDQAKVLKSFQYFLEVNWRIMFLTMSESLQIAWVMSL